MDFGKDETFSNSSRNNVWLQQSISAIASQETPSENAMNTSPLSTSSNGNAAEMRSNDSGDAEGVWSPDIDQAFQEALQIYPPCGRRKIILSDEGKMYGRNELIARYIKIRCGKTRTRKQVSSHIQVLARKKQREEQARHKTQRGENNLSEPSNSAAGSVSPNIQAKTEFTSDPLLSTDVSMPTEALSAAPQPTAKLATSVNRDQIASMQAQVLKAASAISMGTSNPNWSYALQTNNLIGINSQLEQSFYIAASQHNPFNPIIASSLQTNQNCVPKLEQLFADNNGAQAIIPASTSKIANDLTIASSKLILIGFTAYIEQNLKGEGSRIEIVHIPKISSVPLERISLDIVQSKYPPVLQELFKDGPTDAFFLAKCWANMNFEIGDEQNTLFAVDSYYESKERFDITVSTKVCSFGNEVVEKVEIYSPINEDGEGKASDVWHFKLERSPMCEYMVRFIQELKKLQEPSLMNSVLENFTVLQIVTNKLDGSTLMVLAFIFEIRDDGEDEIYTNIYRLIDESSN